ncbi:MAG TPA: glycosyltransferase [Bacteroidia bacterium]|nr:glycosyltransferase [Bacteroidia bacterium]
MKILYIVSRFPYPLEKGDKLRAYHQIKGLAANNEVVLFALSDKDVEEEHIKHLQQICKSVEVFKLSKFRIFLNLVRTTFSKVPWQVGYFYSRSAQKQVNQIISEFKPEHIFCQLIRTSEFVKEYNNIPKTLDYMDVFSKGIERRLPTIPFYLKPLYKKERQRLVNYESTIFDCFDNKVIISEQDRDFIQHPDKNKIVVISNGVSSYFFNPVNHRKEYDIIFNGNMNYPPNVESAEYLVNTILPIVIKKYPRIKVLISGANPSPKVKALASAHVFVSGWVEDIRENFAKSKMLVAPMFMSIGLQNKLLEAMALKIPCITSTLANNALKAKNGESILIADTPEEYAAHIQDLIYYEDKAKMIGLNGHYFVVNNYSWDVENQKLEELIRDTK